MNHTLVILIHDGDATMRIRVVLPLLLLLPSSSVISAAESTKFLIGSWSGKAAGAGGGPPSGDIQVTFAKGQDGNLKGNILVKGEGGLQYSGEMSEITVKKRVVSAKATFKLGENPLVATITGPLKRNSIEGTFLVTSKGEKIGEGTFSITKDSAVSPAKQQGIYKNDE